MLFNRALARTVGAVTGVLVLPLAAQMIGAAVSAHGRNVSRVASHRRGNLALAEELEKLSRYLEGTRQKMESKE